MTTTLDFRNFSRSLIGAIVSCIFVANTYGAPTALGTEPFTSSTKINALPNVMFVLDDSGSMKQDYLPDWAGPYKQLISSVLTVITPPHRFYNGAYNGVAYNPATRYLPPVMYTSSGALDTTTYPSMSGVSVATGGNASATTSVPNWKAVKVDGYGIQSVATANLEGAAYSYTTVPGEYCDSSQLRNCTASATPTGSFTFPSNLRWCTTLANSNATTTSAGTNCKAGNIGGLASSVSGLASTQTTVTSGVTAYRFPRLPKPPTSTITVTVAGTVSGILVGTKQILSASAAGATTTDTATDIAAKINACTYVQAGSCTTVGFSAVSLAGVVTLTTPGVTTKPVVTGATTTVTNFSAGSVPGSSLFTVITPTVTSYPYPGDTVKGANRIDCAGTTCTYVEEMTNYANWYAYYQTRMQMMKTSSSIAFAGVDDKFRVGYYSINNGSGSDFLNLSAFDPIQKNLWYAKFFSAVPFGATPLRGGLANTGRMYAGKLTSLNSVGVTDPIQYSCQQNFTILSTDGYWNDAVTPKQIDGTTAIGQQDGNDDRPYYDGGTYSRTVSHTDQTDLQVGVNTFLVEQRTQQQQTTSTRLSQSVVTTTTYPWKEETTKLQTRTTPLNQSAYNLISKTYPLTSVTKELQENTFKLNSTPRILEKYTYNLTKTTTPLDVQVYKVTKGTQLLTKKVYNVTKNTALLTKSDYKVTKGTSLVSKKIYNVRKGTQLLTQNVYKVTATTYPLQSSTYKLASTTRQLQKSMETSTDGGDTWQPTGWVDAASCTSATTGPGYTRNTTCRYNTATVVTGGLSTCTPVNASTGPNYTVAQSVTCAYEATPTVAAVGTCAVVGQSGSAPYTPSVACAYSATSSVATGQSSCTARNQGASPTSGDKVVCTYDATPTATTGLSSCTWVVPATSASAPKTDCVYQTATNVGGQTACSADAKETATTNGSVWNTSISCGYEATPTTTAGLSTCTWVVPSPSASASRTDCSYETATSATGQATCTAAAAASAVTNASVWNTAVTCGYDATPTTTTGLASCTWVVPSPVASATKTNCAYQAATPLTNQTACTAALAGSATTNGTVWNTSVACTYDAAPATTTTGQASCTWVVPATSASVPRTDCSYETATSATGQTTCTAAANGTATTNAAVWNTGVTCAYDTTPTTTAGQPTCTWVVPSPAASSAKTNCVYNAGSATVLPNQTTCTAVAASTGTTNGTVWSGPSVACAYQTAVTATNQTTCIAGTPSGGPAFVSYSTCGYINGTTSTGNNSCTYVADSTANTYVGPANACAYSTTPTTVNVPLCTAVAQSGTYAAPSKTCTYQATGTNASGLTACTNVAQSSGAYPWVGPNVSCAYSGTATTNSAATTCDANRQVVSPFTGPAVDCTYNATAAVTTNVGNCTTKAQQAGPSYTGGAAIACAYGTTTGWSNATATCNTAAQSAGPAFTGPARDCIYSSPSVDALVGTCTNVPQSAGPSYTQLVAKNCVAGSFPVVGAAVVTTVDSCSTDPTSTGSPIVVSTATSCTYQAPSTVNTSTCTPVAVSGSSPYVTAVTCPVSDTGYVPVAPSCTAAGTPPSTFDGTGKVVECRTTDQIGTPSSPVAVASCTAGTNGTTKVQTQCTNMLSTGPTPVQNCVTADPPSAPSYVKTTCSTTTTSTNVMGCSAPAASAPLWETVTCVDNNDGTSNTLADVAAYYYKADIRTSALNNCTGTPVPPATVGEVLCSVADDALAKPTLNNVPTTTKDNNSKQHMTTFTLGLGASGYMKYSDTYSTDTTGDFSTVKGVSPYAPANGIAADPASGICSWQAGGDCNWTVPVSDEQTTIDDLWHAGVNGRGAYFSATDPVSLASSITAALTGVAAAGGASAAPTLSTGNLSPADSYVFGASFTTVDWTGELVRRTIDPYTGLVSGTDDWAAQAKLDAKTSRNIYVFDASVATTKLKAFTSANYGTNSYFNAPYISAAPNGLTQYLCATPDTCLSATNQDTSHAAGVNLVKYLAGERTNEGTETDNTKYYRQRQHVLGDIVNAQVVYVNKPSNDFADPGYADFVTAQSTRQAVVYAGANDGMLHAFAAKGTTATEVLVDAAAKARSNAALDPLNASLLTLANTATASATAALSADATVGQELWAFIPNAVLPNLYKLADKKYKDKHRYYVDATPEVADVCVSNCGLTSAVWKTILVGGLGRGGRAYYALDVTDPANPKALWEFTDANLGYSYGGPQISKLADGTWVVLLGSGYNNIPNSDGSGGDGIGRLYVLNAATGAQISVVSPISTGVGSTTTPSGLARVTAQLIDGNSDRTIEAVYGGDLSGNLWRFDVNNTIGSPGYDAQLLATLMDADGNAQSITTKPEIGLIKGYKVIFVGTGRYLASSDASDPSVQSFYAIKDPRGTLTSPATAIFDNPGGSPRAAGTSIAGFVKQTQTEVDCPTGVTFCTSGTKVRTSTANAVDFTTDNGWFFDFVGASERVNTDPVLGLGSIYFNTNAPSLLACDVGGKSYSYFLDYNNGGAIEAPGNGSVSGGTAIVGLSMGNKLVSGVAIFRTVDGQIGTLSRANDGTFAKGTPPESSKSSLSRRTSWRGLIRNN